MNIDWKNISPSDFERIVRDLLSAEFGKHVESFKEGKDEGIDLCCDDGNTIIQCKRYCSTFSNLKKVLQEEVKKPKVSQASRYIIVTSLPLSPENKSTIRDLSHNILSTEDIYGGDDLCRLINSHRDIKKSYPCLWLGDVELVRSTIEETIDRTDNEKTENEWNEILNTIRIIAKPPALSDALKILRNHRALVITGEPGIGKTTLARYIVYMLMSEEKYEFAYVNSDINMAYKKFKHDKKQIFLYDDFLGTTFLGDGLRKNEDSDIVKFIHKINHSKNKYFILTTREYIFQQACSRYDSFHEEQLLDIKYVLNLGTLTNGFKARILYNHLWAKKIPFSWIEKLFYDQHGKRWGWNNYIQQIINHRSFNPRVLAAAISTHYNKTPNNFPNHIINFLNDPFSLYKNIFSSQLSELQKLILLITGTFPGSISRQELETSVHSYSQNYSLQETLTDALRVLDGDFLTSQPKSRYSSELEFNIVNPGIRDFVHRQLIDESGILLNLIKSSISASQLRYICQLIKKESNTAIKQIQHSLILKSYNLIKESYSTPDINSKTSIFELALNLSNLESNSEYIKETQILVTSKENEDNFQNLESENADTIVSLIGIVHNKYKLEIKWEQLLTKTLEQINSATALNIISEIINTSQNNISIIALKREINEWIYSYDDYIDQLNSDETMDEAYIWEELSESFPEGFYGIDCTEMHTQVICRADEKMAEEEEGEEEERNSSWKSENRTDTHAEFYNNMQSEFEALSCAQEN